MFVTKNDEWMLTFDKWQQDLDNKWSYQQITLSGCN
jgi:hypothetical protein